MLFEKKQPQIMVELVDVRPHRQVIQLPVPITAIPAKLETGMVVTFNQTQYEIAEAEPDTQDKVRATLHVRLVVKPLAPEVAAEDEEAYDDEDGAGGPDDGESDDQYDHGGQEYVEEADPPYLYATVCPHMPPLDQSSSKLGHRIYQIHEADWRQVEFVSRALAPQIEEALSGVLDITRNHEAPGGYNAVYERVRMTTPLGPEKIAFEEIQMLFPEGRDEIEGVGFFGRMNLVAGGFAFRTGSLTEIYGQIENGVVTALCIGGIGTYDYDSPEVQAMADFCAEHDLCLIDWVAALKLDPETEEFFAFFDPPESFDEVYEQAPL